MTITSFIPHERVAIMTNTIMAIIVSHTTSKDLQLTGLTRTYAGKPITALENIKVSSEVLTSPQNI